MTDKPGKNVFKTIERRSVPEEIIHRIRELVDSGVLAKGSKLPGERDLAKQLGVSRPSLREALRALSLLGILENRPGYGTYLTNTTEHWPSEPFQILFSIKKGAILEIFEVRKALEGAVASMAAVRRSEEDIQVMDRALAGMRDHLNDPEEYDRAELEFHMAVIEAAGNTVIADLMLNLYNLLRIRRSGLLQRQSPGDRRKDFHAHELIHERIQAGDPDGASRAILDHLIKFEERLRLEEREAQGDEAPGDR